MQVVGGPGGPAGHAAVHLDRLHGADDRDQGNIKGSINLSVLYKYRVIHLIVDWVGLT